MFLQPDTDPGDWQSSTSSSSGSSSSDSSSLEDDSSSTSVQVGKRPRKVVTLDHTFLQPLTDVLLNSPHGIRLAVKSIINAWTTSSRCNEKKKRSCVFGCMNRRDTLSHYAQCDPLWTCILTITGCSDVQELHTNKLERLCLINPTPLRCFQLALAFRVFHLVKFNHSRNFIVLARDGDFHTLYGILYDIVAAQWRDMPHPNA